MLRPCFNWLLCIDYVKKSFVVGSKAKATSLHNPAIFGKNRGPQGLPAAGGVPGYRCLLNYANIHEKQRVYASAWKR
jgi:hypothetical protein